MELKIEEIELEHIDQDLLDSLKKLKEKGMKITISAISEDKPSVATEDIVKAIDEAHLRFKPVLSGKEWEDTLYGDAIQ